ncbi:MAG: hypothetical protein ABUL57_00420 [Chloroflexota bacterium]
MISFQALRLMHRHGENDYAQMSETREHDSADHDPERSWIRGARIFRCDTCSSEVIVVPPDEEPGNTKVE